jgi:hypothetical protein
LFFFSWSFHLWVISFKGFFPKVSHHYLYASSLPPDYISAVVLRGTAEP